MGSSEGPSLLEIDLAVSMVSLAVMAAKTGLSVNPRSFGSIGVLLDVLRRDLRIVLNPSPVITQDKVPDPVLREMIQESLDRRPPKLTFQWTDPVGLSRLIELLESFLVHRSISQAEADWLQVYLIELRR